jgi:methyl-accepting chemotaxis protein
LSGAIAALAVVSYLTSLGFKIKLKRLGLSTKTMTVQRWTDEMLDNLASSSTELRESVTELRESVTELRESVTELRKGFADVQENITEIKDSIDGLRITSQALLQVAAQSQRDMEAMKERQAELEQQQTEFRQRQAESDQRFNVLLEEVRFLIRGKTDD